MNSSENKVVKDDIPVEILDELTDDEKELLTQMNALGISIKDQVSAPDDGVPEEVDFDDDSDDSISDPIVDDEDGSDSISDTVSNVKEQAVSSDSASSPQDFSDLFSGF